MQKLIILYANHYTCHSGYKAADVACEPGFLMTTISSLAGKSALDGESECGLIVDEMSIRSGTLWDRKNPNKFVGNVNYGKTEGEDPENIAKNVFVIMAAGNWVFFNK